MSPSVYVFTPNYPNVSVLPFNENPAVATLLFSIWRDMTAGLKPRMVSISQLSLRSLFLRNHGILSCKRIDDSARNNGWETSEPWGAGVSSLICELPRNCTRNYGGSITTSYWRRCLTVEGPPGNTYQERFIESSGMWAFGFPERGGLLVRAEYEAAWESFNNDIAKAHKCGGVVVTGQPGIAKRTPWLFNDPVISSSFKKTASVDIPSRQILISLPAGTWALSNYDQTQLPCAAFLEAASWGTAWIVQTTSPLEHRWKKWKTAAFSGHLRNGLLYYRGDDSSGVVTYSESTPAISDAITKGGVLLRALACGYRETLLQNANMKRPVEGAAKLRPEEKDEAGRRIQFVDLASDRIKTIVSYATANTRAQKRIKFYETISTQPGFEASAGQIFKGLVLSWLHTRPDLRPLHCSPAVHGLRDLQILPCREKQTSYFGSLTALNEVKVDKLFLSPTSQTLAAVDAIVFTDKFIITVQVAVSGKPSTKGSDFAWADIKKSIPRDIREDRDWRHMYITDSVNKVQSLRNQTSSDLPKDIRVYYEVFNVGRLDIGHDHLEVFDENKQCACRNSVDVDENGNNF
ncbi:hypothetical protein EDB85DRAFT_1887706 [Lactarius pseudohatsudake]|nr:hypothetical protein EDB85DRAFT_1887706 [Lactarius pseudohatsudake]